MSGSSPTIENEAVTLRPDGVDQQPASSPADQGQEKSPADLVFEALGQTDEGKSPDPEQDPSDPAADPKGETAQADKPEETDDLGEVTEDELKKYGPKTQKRIRQLLGHRDELNRTLEEIKPRADKFEAIERYAGANRLSMEDVASTMSLAALVRTDPEAAFDPLMKLVHQIAEATGRILPKEVQEAVNLGRLSEDEAKRLVRAESRAALVDQRARAQTEEVQSERENARLQALGEQARTTVTQWENDQKRSDPDWQLKQGRIAELAELAVLKNGFPQTKQALIQTMDGILTKVNGEMARFAPRPREVRAVTGNASTTATREPKSSQEAAFMALGLNVG
jgi:hypothetical protein